MFEYGTPIYKVTAWMVWFRRRPSAFAALRRDRSGYGGRARICKAWRLEGRPGSDLQVLRAKDEGGQRLKKSSINRVVNAWRLGARE
jgi:hypothetical protein